MVRPDLAVIPMPEGVQLRAGDEEIYFLQSESPALVAEILNRLDGTTSTEGILADIGSQHAGLLEAMLRELTTARLIWRDGGRADGEVDRYLSHFLGPEGAREAALRTHTVAVVGHDALVALMAQNLEAHRVGVNAGPLPSDDDDPALRGVDVVVCLWERPDLSSVDAMNRQVCQDKMPCLFVDLSHGRHATVGPFYVPREGACYACFRERLRQNAASFDQHVAAEEWMRKRRRPLPGYGILPTFRYQAVGLAGSEIVAYLTRYRGLRTLNRAITIDLERLTCWSEPVWRIPWCAVCGVQ